MIRFDILTIFPEVVEPYLSTSILKRAQEKRLVKFSIHNLRRWTADSHRTVDDKPYGGGPGMIMKVEPIFKAVSALKNSKVRRSNAKSNPKSKTRVILLSASGKPLTQRVAEQCARRYQRIVLICGRYEGVDHRVAQYVADEELSIGPYVLTGGEVPAMAFVDAVTRLVPGVIRKESLEEESFSLGWRPEPGPASAGTVQGEYPQYTRPEVFYPNLKKKGTAWRVPKILLSGDHRRIVAWRAQHMRGAKKH